MADPVQSAIDAITRDHIISKGASGSHLTNNFLNNVADVFERYGFATTRAYLADKQAQGREEATALLRVLHHLEQCEPVRKNRAIGRLIIKTLNGLFGSQPRGTGGQKSGAHSRR